MNILNNIKLKSKLFAVVAFLIAVSLGISAAVYVATRSVADSTQSIMSSTDRMHHAGRATANLLAYVRNVEFLPLELTEEQRIDFEKKSDDELRRLRVRLEKIQIADDGSRSELQKLSASIQDYETRTHRQVVKLAREKDLDGATKIAFEGDKIVTEMRVILRSFEDNSVKHYTKEAEDLKIEQNKLLLAILIIAGFGSGLGLLAAFTTIVIGVTKPLMKVVAAMKALAGGNVDVDVAGADRQDEIGEMARTLHVFRENAEARLSLEVKANDERDLELRRQAKVEQLITHFRSNIVGIRHTLDEQLGSLQNSAESLTRIAQEAAEGASTAEDASQSSSSNVTQVASAAGELTAASREISTQVHKASESVEQAMLVSEQADQDISSLANLAERIGAIVHIISSIAEQTNMLALNATIEAARAGEAGRSFAVVASEVKTLANQTAKATDDISAQVSAIQAATAQAVNSIRTITQQVTEIQGRTTAIAAAVEEQEASTHEISRSITLASDGSTRVASSVGTMTRSVDNTSEEASSVRLTSEKLADIAGKLTHSVDEFLENVTEDVKDRRAAIRKTVRQAVVILAQGKRAQTIVHDLSEIGARIDAIVGLASGQTVELEWAGGQRLKGRVIWVNEGHAGIALDQAVPRSILNAA